MLWHLYMRVTACKTRFREATKASCELCECQLLFTLLSQLFWHLVRVCFSTCTTGQVPSEWQQLDCGESAHAIVTHDNGYFYNCSTFQTVTTTMERSLNASPSLCWGILDVRSISVSVSARLVLLCATASVSWKWYMSSLGYWSQYLSSQGAV